MKTEDEVVALFVAANPVPHPDLLEPVEPLDATDLVPSSRKASAVVEIQESGPVKKTRPSGAHRLPALAAAAVSVVVAIGIALVMVLAARGSEPDVGSAPPVGSADVAAAEAFMAAWIAGDGEAVPFSSWAGGTPGRVELSPVVLRVYEHWEALHDWFRAVGYEFHPQRCQLIITEDVPPGYSVPDVFCSYTFENDLTRALGRGPVASFFHFSVEDDGIEHAADPLHFDAYADIGHMFSEWMLRNHPDDHQRMYSYLPESSPLDRSVLPMVSLTPMSIALWERYVDEFVASPEAVAPPSAEGLTSPEYGAQARRICAAASIEFATVLAGLGPPGPYLGHNPAAHQAAVRISEEALAELRTLRPPEEDRAHLDEIFSLMEREIAVDRQLAAAASAGATALVDELNRERVNLTHQKDRLGGGDFAYCPVNLGA